MSTKLNIFFLLFSILFVLNTYSQDYRIAKWYNDFPSATVISYDDWSPGHPTHGLTEHLRTNLPGTFYVTTGNAWRVDDYSNMSEAIDSVGLEIGNHTVSHPNLTSVNSTQLENEINGAKTILDNELSNYSALTFCYPLGAFDNQIRNLTMENHIAARGISLPFNGIFNYNFASSEEDYFNLPTVTVNSNISANEFNNWIDAGINNGGLLTFMLHSINGEGVLDTWWDAIDISFYRELMDTLKSRSDETWVTTVKDAVVYHKERNSADLTIQSENDTLITLNLTDTLSNNSIYNHPLSIYLKIPDFQSYSSVKQNGEDIAYSIIGDTIVFNAIPDQGAITIQKELLVSNSTIKVQSEFNIYPNPVTDIINISTESLSTKDCNGQIFNLSGQEVLSFSQQNNLNVSQLKPGVYFLIINTDQSVYKKRFIKK